MGAPIDRDSLARGLAALGLGARPGLEGRLAAYLELLEEWNPAYGLVGATGTELVVKHILDSLAPLDLIRGLLLEVAARRDLPGAQPSPEGPLPAGLWIADFGTGAGLPGIPLALALPEVKVSLVDRMGRRIRFLEAAQALLGLSNVEIVESEIERAPGTWDLITFRAFRPFERKLFSKVFAALEPDGFLAAYKGRHEKSREELGAIEGLYANPRLFPLRVPFLDEERCLVALEKAAPGRSR